ncbi:MAG: bifunctional 3-deoxy-7-phosphoheptulonate synthase/chorismate mutase type II [Bacteroidales bacterium]|nr:bifunctional 3-deoxy-7-phosphoheptulonate synthase/chorismate mutase type II [Bacteroidales bacterium]
MSIELNILPIQKWLNFDSHPIIISGPCSAESEEQLLRTARELSQIPNVRIFRAGIWKPRTRPNQFEGVGNIGLEWLKKVKQESGLLTTVEVANPKHVEEAIKHDVDILWLGARTVVNPFSVQEIAEALQGVDIPVIIKNPVNPDINLWIGALERINRAGITKLAAIHRGFYFFESSPFRNAPMWEIPIELKRLYPALPLFCDPSHICGNKDLIQSVSQKALDLEMEGLMIESHYNPDIALTDANQQITPKHLANIFSKLVIREESVTGEFETKLDELRTEIDKLDAELIDILLHRMKIVEEIGEYKRDNNITILQIKRWSEIIKNRLAHGIKIGLNRDFLLKILQLVHKESIQKQTDIMNKGKK